MTLAAAPAPVERSQRTQRAGWRTHLGKTLPLIVIWVPLLINATHVVGFTLWTTWLSFTPSDLLPDYTLAGLRSYWAVTRAPSTQVAYLNLVIYSFGFVALATVLGFVLAVLLDQRVRGENLLRTIYLYPLAVSFVVTGTVWSWLLNPGLGIQKFVRNLGWETFRFDWIIDRDMALYTIVIAAAWHGAGFAMALFLAGLRSIDPDLHKAAQIDGASPTRFYLRVVLPSIGAIVIAVLVILLQFAIKTFDLVRALTGGGPGIATTLPALVVYDFMFQRGQLGRGSAAAVLLLLALLAVLVPYWAYTRWRAHARKRQEPAHG
jgi:glucose/mannose transport system permease protein